MCIGIVMVPTPPGLPGDTGPTQGWPKKGSHLLKFSVNISVKHVAVNISVKHVAVNIIVAGVR